MKRFEVHCTDGTRQTWAVDHGAARRRISPDVPKGERLLSVREVGDARTELLASLSRRA